MKRLIILGVVLLAGAPAASWAQEGSDSSIAAEPPVLSTIAEKRAWLGEQLVKGLDNPREVAQVQTRLNRMSPQQIDALTNITLAQRIPQNRADLTLQQAQWELQRAIWLRQMMENELWWRRYNAVGYRPVITWLPEGTHFGASAVVSPDRRYVRVSPAPFFSSVGPVYSYNLNTGQTRRLPQYGTGTPPHLYRHPEEGYRAGEIPNLPTPPKADPPRVFTDSHWGRGR